MERRSSARVHAFAVFAAVCTFLLLIAGALVTSNDAGLAVPDWPLSYGSLAPPMVGGVLYEHSHRMIASFVGLLTIVLAVWLWRREPRRWVRRLGFATLGLVMAQGLLGGITVLFYLPIPVSVAHASLAQLFFCAVASLALFTSGWWQSQVPQVEDAGAPPLRSLGVATCVAILLQLILGAAFRHKGAGFVPHLVGAGGVTLLVTWTTGRVLRRYQRVVALRRFAVLLAVLLAAQLLLGLGAYWSLVAARGAPQPVPFVVGLTVTHVAAGALTLAASLLLTLCCFRILKSAGSLALASPAEQATV